MSTEQESIRKRTILPRSFFSLRQWELLGTGLFNLLVFSIIIIYLFPIVYMVASSFMRPIPAKAWRTPKPKSYTLAR